MSQGFGIESVDVKKSFRSLSKPTQVADIRCIQHSLVEYFADIEDPRVERWFEQAQAQQFQGIDVSYDKRIEKAHHRTEIREGKVCTRFGFG